MNGTDKDVESVDQCEKCEANAGERVEGSEYDYLCRECFMVEVKHGG